MDIDIHITNATPVEIKEALQAISGSKERQGLVLTCKDKPITGA